MGTHWCFLKRYLFCSGIFWHLKHCLLWFMKNEFHFYFLCKFLLNENLFLLGCDSSWFRYSFGGEGADRVVRWWISRGEDEGGGWGCRRICEGNEQRIHRERNGTICTAVQRGWSFIILTETLPGCSFQLFLGCKFVFFSFKVSCDKVSCLCLNLDLYNYGCMPFYSLLSFWKSFRF